MKKYTKREIKELLKSNDGWLSTHTHVPIASKIAIKLSKTSVSPNYVTLMSLMISVVAFFCLCTGYFFYLLIGAFLIQVYYLLDCVDGRLAKLKNMTSKFGAWLDQNINAISESLFFIGFAVGYFNQTEDLSIFVILSIVFATRYILNIAATGMDAFFIKNKKNALRRVHFFDNVLQKLSKVTHIKKSFFVYGVDTPLYILTAGAIINQLRLTLCLFILIHIVLLIFLTSQALSRK